MYEDALPWWASSQWQMPGAPEEHLPALDLIAHHGGDPLGLSKGGAARRVDEALAPRCRLVDVACASRPVAAGGDLPTDVALDVPRGLEDAAQREFLARLGAPAPEGVLESALHSGVLCVAPPLHTAALALVTDDALPVALAAHFVMGRAALPRDVLDALFAERVEALGKHGAGHERLAPLAASERALLAAIDAAWAACPARDAALAAWLRRAPAPHRTFHVVVDRSSYVFPTLSTSVLEEHLASLVTSWLGTPRAPRGEADLTIKLVLAPRLGAAEPLHAGPRAHVGNPSGTMLFLLHAPAAAQCGASTAAADALREAMSAARAHALAALVPTGEAPAAVGTLHSADPHLGDALERMLQARGLSTEVVRGAADDASLSAALVALPEKPREMAHAGLFDMYVDEMAAVAAALEPDARALVTTCEPRMLTRAVRELENRARRDHLPYTLRLEALAWDTSVPGEHAPTHTDGDEEARLRGGMRTFYYHRLFLACVGKGRLYV